MNSYQHFLSIWKSHVGAVAEKLDCSNPFWKKACLFHTIRNYCHYPRSKWQNALLAMDPFQKPRLKLRNLEEPEIVSSDSLQEEELSNKGRWYLLDASLY